MDRVDEFVNVKDMLWALVSSHPEGKKSKSREGQTHRRVEISRQGRKSERQLDNNHRLIHNNLGVHRDEKDREEWRQP